MNSKSERHPFRFEILRITALRSAHFVLAGLILALSGCLPATPAPPTPAPTATGTSSPASTPTPDPTPVSSTLTPTATRPVSICSPLGSATLAGLAAIITQPFIAPSLAHEAGHPDWVHKEDGHHGVDLGSFDPAGKLVTGLPVLAALDGRIAAVIHDRPPYGNMLMIETSFERIPPGLIAAQQITPGSSLYTLYAHLQNMLSWSVGQTVTCGEWLAETGMTGATSGPHLHFETRWGPAGETFTSMAYYRADASPQEMSNYERWRMSAEFHLFDPLALLAVH